MADYWLVGHALAHGHTVVTHEVPSVSAKRIKIPNPYVGLAIPCMTPFEMLRRARVRFVLGVYAKKRVAKGGFRSLRRLCPEESTVAAP